MSETDSFINEVSEEVRKDKLFKLFRKYGWIPVVLIVLIVGGATFNEVRNARAEAAAQAAGDAVLEALNQEDPTARAASLAALDRDGEPGRAAVLGFLEAASEAEAGNVDGAVAILDGIADDAGAGAIYRDLATLKSVILGAESTEPADRIARLDAIAVPNAPFRLLAIEQIALAQVEQGNTDAALDTLRELLGEGGVTQGLRQRAQQLIVSLGGTLAVL